MMLGRGRKMCTVLKHTTSFRRIFPDGRKTELKVDPHRNLCLTSQRCRQLQRPPEDEEAEEKPIKFSTSKASHRIWKVDRSLGSNFERPWWKVLPVSLVGVCFLLWCIFRKESVVDQQLEKQLYEHLPGLLSDEDNDDTKPGS
ncbi:protein CCSMST1 isoform X2 [Megalops cyprinoides]|uniref:protein CCSMST1 isoform X2 n=1 Tax=Megalops cyprinoides TaxID=118141 RepID=UPI001864F5B5|nr:protein CCSMST1 isoform X2 [Megalops cyprinoides]